MLSWKALFTLLSLHFEIIALLLFILLRSSHFFSYLFLFFHFDLVSKMLLVLLLQLFQPFLVLVTLFYILIPLHQSLVCPSHLVANRRLHLLWLNFRFLQVRFFGFFMLKSLPHLIPCRWWPISKLYLIIYPVCLNFNVLSFFLGVGIYSFLSDLQCSYLFWRVCLNSFN